MSRLIRVAAVALLVCVLLATTAAAHKHRRHGGSSPAHQKLEHTAEDLKLWSLVTASLESRNYSRPAAPGVSGALGVDVPVLVTPETWSCLLENGYSYSIVRAWHSTCMVDTNGAITVANAWKAGVQHVDSQTHTKQTCALREAFSSMSSADLSSLFVCRFSLLVSQLRLSLRLDRRSASGSDPRRHARRPVRHAVVRHRAEPGQRLGHRR